MTQRWHAIEGAPYPLGISYVASDDAYNFALYSKHARRVTLLLYGADDVETPLLTFGLDPLRNRTGRIWHFRISCAGLERARYYAYSVHGPPGREATAWHTFDPDKVLLDPYAREIHFPPGFDRAAACAPGSNAGQGRARPALRAPASTVAGESEGPSPSRRRPRDLRTPRAGVHPAREQPGDTGQPRDLCRGRGDDPVPPGAGSHRRRAHAGVPARPGRRRLLGLLADELLHPARRLRRRRFAGPRR